MLALDRFVLSFCPYGTGHHNRWGRDLVGTELDAASEVVMDEEVHDSSGK